MWLSCWSILNVSTGEHIHYEKCFWKTSLQFQAAEGLIKKVEVSDGILNMVEMAVRAYDPCYACATHTLPGQMPLDVKIYKRDGALLHNLRRP